MERLVPFIVTKIYKDSHEADQRLFELKLTRKGLGTVRQIARHYARTANPFFPANAAGTFSYQYGTWSLRNQHVGKEWHVDRFGGVECIRNDKEKIRIAFCNVDLACDDEHPPKPRSEKGAGAERATQSSLFDGMDQIAQVPLGEWSFYYLMVDQDGKAELTWPVVQGGKFTGFVERIYLHDGSDDEIADIPLDDGDIADGFDPQVARKS